MQANDDDAERSRGWMPKDVREVPIERHEDPTLIAGSRDESIIIDAGETFISRKSDIVAANS